MSKESATGFIETVRRMGLVSDSQLATLSQQILVDSTLSPRDVAAKLVEQQSLTAFQADKLLAGRGDECVLAGRYRILEQLGAGAMGTVYKALDAKLDRVVAIKILPEQSIADRDAVARFEREAKALAKLAHPNIVQAHDSGEERQRHFLVMECVEGASLAQVLREQGRLAPTVAADFVYQAALGLQHAHEKGLVHRDLKPSNLLLSRNRQVKILDLGLARFLQDQVGDATLTREGAGMGTPDYMAPEQFHDARHVDERSDIYSLGCTLYHLLTGTVPFPGSSLSEKYDAHERSEPPPIEESSPEIPAGLAMVVARMMAKSPAKRFQSAREVAEALAPYVAGSSHAVLHIKGTASWHGSMLALSVVPLRVRRRRQLLRAAGASAALLAIAAVAFWSGGMIRPSPPPPLSAEGPGVSDPPAEAPADPDVLTVAQDGSAQFRSINAAMEQVRPGMTISVTDDAVYTETISIGSPSQHTGITLDAPRHATISIVRPSTAGVLISNVSNVTLRGFRFRSDAPRATMVGVMSRADGLILDGLEMMPGSANDYDGVTLKGANQVEGGMPAVIRNCVVRRPQVGIGIMGIDNDYETFLRCSRIMVLNNQFTDPSAFAVALRGSLSEILVAGNVIRGGGGYAAIQFDKWSDDTQKILVANNTIFEFTPSLRVWDRRVAGKGIEVSNNLILGATDHDMTFTDSGGQLLQIRGPGDGRLIHQFWSMRRNWREVKVPPSEVPASKSWIPPSELDTRSDRIEVLSRDPHDKDFLRPAADSPLASSGAGHEDPTLPQYVGAIPPANSEQWDWQTKTWAARYPKMLLTVSQDLKDGAEFRSISEALAKVDRPGMTIRVLDNATYTESVHITDPTLHARLTLEASNGAMISPPATDRFGILIQHVPDVTVRGFRLNASHEPVFLIEIFGRSTGAVVERIDASAQAGKTTTIGVQVENLGVSSDDTPIIIRDSTFSRLGAGVRIIGNVFDARQPVITSGVLIQNNNIFACIEFGIEFDGLLRNILIASNRVWDCGTGISVTNIFEGSQGLLIANNTLKNPQACFRALNIVAEGASVEFVNNVVLADRAPDLYFTGQNISKLATWRMHSNWRLHQATVGSVPAGQELIPTTNDTVVEKIELKSAEPKDKDFMRPPDGSPLATSGRGGGLPRYVGAVPPDGTDPWDWQKTFQSRRRPAIDAPATQGP